MFKVIFSGADETGKTTTAQALAVLASQYFKREIKVYSLGYALRLLAIELRLLTHYQAFTKPLNYEHRQILRAVGQTARHVEPRYWVSLLQFDDPGYWIIDDVRHLHDFEMLTYKGAYSVYLDAGNIDHTIASFEDLERIYAIANVSFDVPHLRRENVTPEQLAQAIFSSVRGKQFFEREEHIKRLFDIC